MTLLNGIRFEQVEKKKDEKLEKKFLPLFERTGPGIGKEVETSWKKSLEKVKIHKKAIYAKNSQFYKKVRVEIYL